MAGTQRWADSSHAKQVMPCPRVGLKRQRQSGNNMAWQWPVYKMAAARGPGKHRRWKRSQRLWCVSSWWPEVVVQAFPRAVCGRDGGQQSRGRGHTRGHHARRGRGPADLRQRRGCQLEAILFRVASALWLLGDAAGTHRDATTGTRRRGSVCALNLPMLECNDRRDPPSRGPAEGLPPRAPAKFAPPEGAPPRATSPGTPPSALAVGGIKPSVRNERIS
jgi:hypothetical protein